MQKTKLIKMAYKVVHSHYLKKAESTCRTKEGGCPNHLLVNGIFNERLAKEKGLKVGH